MARLGRYLKESRIIKLGSLLSYFLLNPSGQNTSAWVLINPPLDNLEHFDNCFHLKIGRKINSFSRRPITTAVHVIYYFLGNRYWFNASHIKLNTQAPKYVVENYFTICICPTNLGAISDGDPDPGLGPSNSTVNFSFSILGIYNHMYRMTKALNYAADDLIRCLCPTKLVFINDIKDNIEKAKLHCLHYELIGKTDINRLLYLGARPLLNKVMSIIINCSDVYYPEITNASRSYITDSKTATHIMYISYNFSFCFSNEKKNTREGQMETSSPGLDQYLDQNESLFQLTPQMSSESPSIVLAGPMSNLGVQEQDNQAGQQLPEGVRQLNSALHSDTTTTIHQQATVMCSTQARQPSITTTDTASLASCSNYNTTGSNCTITQVTTPLPAAIPSSATLSYRTTPNFSSGPPGVIGGTNHNTQSILTGTQSLISTQSTVPSLLANVQIPIPTQSAHGITGSNTTVVQSGQQITSVAPPGQQTVAQTGQLNAGQANNTRQNRPGKQRHNNNRAFNYQTTNWSRGRGRGRGNYNKRPRSPDVIAEQRNRMRIEFRVKQVLAEEFMMKPSNPSTLEMLTRELVRL